MLGGYIAQSPSTHVQADNGQGTSASIRIYAEATLPDNADKCRKEHLLG